MDPRTQNECFRMTDGMTHRASHGVVPPLARLAPSGHSRRYPAAAAVGQAEAATTGFIKSVKLLNGLSPEDVEQLCDSFTRCKYRHGDKIVTQGEAGDVFYIIEEGIVDVRPPPPRSAPLSFEGMDGWAVALPSRGHSSYSLPFSSLLHIFMTET